jgi:hypothetical protein
MSDQMLMGYRIVTSEDVPPDTVIFAQSLRRGLERRDDGFVLIEELRELGRIVNLGASTASTPGSEQNV